MELLPIVEMYCRWELQEECSDLEALMLRFDSVSELESHELGRSLLCMVRDDDAGFVGFPIHAQAVHRANPFDAIRHRLAAVDVAIQGLHAQVQLVLVSCSI